MGIDPSRYIANKANESGVPALNDFFSADLARAIKAEHGSADIVTANRVFANIDDLADVLNGIKELLAPDGTFVFETGYMVDIVRDMLFDTIYHEHLGYDLVQALPGLFQRFDLELIGIERVMVKGGSLRGFVQHRGGSRQVSPTVSEFIADETAKGYNTAEPFQSLASALDTRRTELVELLKILQVEGKTIAGYGASVGSTTQIHHLGLGELLKFLVDDDTRNQNLYSPSFHIPVMPSQAIYDQKADYVVILAWRYADPILKKHQAFLERGGHFIIPFPEVQIV